MRDIRLIDAVAIVVDRFVRDRKWKFKEVEGGGPLPCYQYDVQLKDMIVSICQDFRCMPDETDQILKHLMKKEN